MNQLALLRDICGIIARTADPEKILDRIVSLITTRLGIEGASLYLIDDREDDRVRRASAGLQAETEHGFPSGNAFVDLILERAEPLLLVGRDWDSRPRPHGPAGQTPAPAAVLGLPLTGHDRTVGVLALLTSSREKISESDVPAFAVLSRRIGAALEYAGVLAELKTGFQEYQPAPGMGGPGLVKRRLRPVLAGTPVSWGFSGGQACQLDRDEDVDALPGRQPGNGEQELRRFEQALMLAREEVEALLEKGRILGKEHADIMQAHLMLLDDPTFRESVAGLVHTGRSAEDALQTTFSQFRDTVQQRADPYLRARAMDVEDLGRRLLGYLRGRRPRPEEALAEDSVLVGMELSSLDLLSLRRENVKAIALARGGPTTHSSILARSFEIPMVIGVENLLETVQEGDPVIVDANSGLVFCRPPPSIREAYREIEAHQPRRIEVLKAFQKLKAKTRDGHEVFLGANIGVVTDLELVRKYGADHVGLYRTEYPFLSRRGLPSEQEQFSLYREIIVGAADRTVTFRTLDVGGDKVLSDLEHPQEHNPHLGWRSIRISLELDEIFRTQIRAILRASAFGRAQILLPMITSVEEFRKALAIFTEEKLVLKERGLPFDPGVRLGVLVEVPGTVKILKALLRYADFASIGTNDLIQYTLAVDRGNVKVAPLYTPFHPAVISTIHEAVLTCRRLGREVSICGEAASVPACAYLYMAMEIGRLSMHPACIPIIKAMIRRSALVCAKVVLQHALEMETAEEIEAYVRGILPTHPLLEVPV